MKTLTINSGSVGSVIEVPTSKSYANRFLILAAQSEHSIRLNQLGHSTDVLNLKNCLIQLGIKFYEKNNYSVVENSFLESESKDLILEVGDGGTTARFLAVMLLKGKKKYVLKLSGRLKDRPWQEFVDLVVKYGAKAQLLGDELHLQGPIHLPDSIEIDCSKTTQFATAFKLCFPLVEVKPIHLLSSESYWLMNEKVLSELKKHEASIPLDWSSAGFFLAFGAIHQEIFFPGLTFDPFQADAKFYSFLKNLGHIEEMSDGIKVKPILVKQNLSFDAQDALDLVPALSVYLAYQEGKHQIKNIRNLVYKESDRLSETCRLLKSFNKEIWIEDNSLWIKGSHHRMINSMIYDPPQDHRLVMVAALMMKLNGGGILTQADAVKKSFPNFFDYLK